MKLLFISNVMLWIPFGLIFGIAALFGAKTVTWNQEHVTGIGGLLLALALTAFLCFLGTAVTGLMTYLGLRLYTAVRPGAVLTYHHDAD